MTATKIGIKRVFGHRDNDVFKINNNSRDDLH